MRLAARPEADVIAAIDALERDEVDDLVDWQMSDSPAAHVELGPWARVDEATHAAILRAMAHIDEQSARHLNNWRCEVVAARFAPPRARMSGLQLAGSAAVRAALGVETPEGLCFTSQVIRGAPSGFRTPDPLIKSQCLTFDVVLRYS